MPKLYDVAVPFQKFAQAINVNLATVVRRVSAELFNKITLRTPVDTGRARASWQVSERAPGTGQTVVVIPDNAPGTYGPPNASNAAAMAKASGKTSIFIVSNVPYMEALENGHSEQAPVGMVQISIAEVVGSIKAILKKMDA